MMKYAYTSIKQSEEKSMPSSDSEILSSTNDFWEVRLRRMKRRTQAGFFLVGVTLAGMLALLVGMAADFETMRLFGTLSIRIAFIVQIFILLQTLLDSRRIRIREKDLRNNLWWHETH
jgi:hypothetical protein